MNLRNGMLIAVAALAAALVFPGCDALTGDESSSGSGGGGAASIFNGIWFGWGETISKETGGSDESSARVDGIEFKKGEIVRFVDGGEWFDVSDFTSEDSLVLEETSNSQIYTLDGSQVGDDQEILTIDKDGTITISLPSFPHSLGIILNQPNVPLDPN